MTARAETLDDVPMDPTSDASGGAGDDLAAAASGSSGGLRDQPSMEARQALAKTVRGRCMSPPQRCRSAPANAFHDSPGNYLQKLVTNCRGRVSGTPGTLRNARPRRFL